MPVLLLLALFLNVAKMQESEDIFASSVGDSDPDIANITIVSAADMLDTILGQKNATGANDTGMWSSYMVPPTKKTVHQMKPTEIKNKKLRVVAMIEPPFVNYLNLSREVQEKVKDGLSPGIVMEILRELQESYNLQYEFFVPEDNLWGSPVGPNGTWTGAFGYLERGEADIVAGASIVRLDRSLISDFSYPFMHSDTGLLIRSPKKYSDNTFLIVVAPFSWEVWLLTAFAIFASGMILKALATALALSSEIQYTWFASVWVFFSVFVQQGLTVQPKSWTCRTMLAFWWLGSVTLIATFTGNLVALFAVEKTTYPFTDLKTFVDSVQYGGYNVYMEGSSTTRAMFIRNSKRADYQRLWNEMSDNHKLFFVPNVEDGVRVVKATSKKVLMGSKELLDLFAFIDCDITVLDFGVLPVWMSIALAKHSPYTELLSDKVRDLVERGFIIKWMNDYKSQLATTHQKGCSRQQGISNKGFLGISKAQGVFWMLLIGAGLSATGLLSEHGVQTANKAVVSTHPTHEDGHANHELDAGFQHEYLDSKHNSDQYL